MDGMNFTELNMGGESRREARIRELKARREELLAKKEMRRMAANRARSGDPSMASAYMSNEYAQRMNRSAQAADRENMRRKDIEELKNEIDGLYITMPKDKQSRFNQRLKIDRLTKQLRDHYGVEYKPTGFMFGNPDERSADEWESFRIENTDKNGNWISEEARELYSTRETDTADDAEKAKKGAGTDTADEAAAKKDSAKKNAYAAIDEAVGASGKPSAYELTKGKGTYTRTVLVDGKTYTVTFTKTTGGKVIAKCNGFTMEF